MALPTAQQVDAALRHAYTSAGTVLAICALAAVIPKEDVQPILDALHQIGDGLEQVFGGASKLVIIIGPVVAVWMGKIAAAKAGFLSQLKSVTAAASVPENIVQKTEMIAATNSIPEVAGVITTNTAPGMIVAGSIPETTVAPAGTPAAASIAANVTTKG